MIKFKKYLVAPLATLMCLSPVFAADTPEDDHLTNLSYTVDQSYKWSAPADITFTTNIDRESKTGAISVTENIIAGNETLKISIDSNAKFQIESEEHSFRDYKVLKNSDELSAGSLVLEVASGTNGATQNLDFVLQGVKSGNTSQVAGTYTGTLNFVANIETTGSGNLGGSGGSGGSGGGGSTSGIDMSNINVMDGTTTLAAGDFSMKGNLVTINDTQYRVLAVDGTMAKVMSMANDVSSEFNGSKVTVSFGGTDGQKYADSNLDNTMTNYYNSLPSAIQNAIVEQNINQSMYSWNNGTNASANFSAWYKDPFTDTTTSGDNYYLTRTAEINVGTRKVFALDLDDVISYLGANSTPQDVNEMFFGVRNSVSRLVWLRSAHSDSSIYAFCVFGDDGYLNNNYYSYSYEVRPAFVLDLSLLSE